MPIFMKYTGIDGDVTTEGHEKWIEIHGLEWGTGRAISTRAGRSVDREGSTPAVSEITVTKVTGQCFAQFAACLAGPEAGRRGQDRKGGVRSLPRI